MYHAAAASCQHRLHLPQLTLCSFLIYGLRTIPQTPPDPDPTRVVQVILTGVPSELISLINSQSPLIFDNRQVATLKKIPPPAASPPAIIVPISELFAANYPTSTPCVVCEKPRS